MNRERVSVSEREKLRVVGVSVSEWETESKRESSGEGDCEGITGQPNVAIGRSLNDLKPFLSFIDIYFETSPFRIFSARFIEEKRRNASSPLCFQLKPVAYSCLKQRGLHFPLSRIYVEVNAK